MKILHFMGVGTGMMLGIIEYVVAADDEANTEEFEAPGFKLESETDIDDLPASFPVDTTLVPLI